ncbi:hypothetical protein [Saccharibacillus alkalitolerans]|uniref:DUF5666 domain-containing protein n=1 Tax=Saccharibacillus alkalitolerans TaxID=2705290 RepID=A0ABX0F7Q6_9BACL|nr:hypothetical protein [Saccharibacillus alkalitolerans]NGZ75236.1 hypothetical protein [Saccharibacillus alkalitolerans]
MDKKKTGTLLSLLGLSVLLSACEAVTAQNIPSTLTAAGSGGAGMGGPGARMEMPGSFAGRGGFNGRGGIRQALDADLIGRIAALEGDKMTLELLESGTGTAGGGSRSPGGAAADPSDWESTGITVMLTLGSGVKITGESGSLRSDGLKKGQVVMVWYKEGSERVERIRTLK